MSNILIGKKQSRLMQSIGHKYANPAQIVGHRMYLKSNIETMPQPANVADMNEVQKGPDVEDIKYMPTGLKKSARNPIQNTIERRHKRK